MSKLMRCLYCGLLQDEPKGVKVCVRCGGELVFEQAPPPESYVRAWMELDQISAPSDRIVDRHLVVTIQTPAQVPDGEKAPTSTGRAPLGFHAVLDVSGSMRGPKIEAAKEAVRQALLRLQDGDVFSLVTFAQEVNVLLPAAVVGANTRGQVESLLNQIAAGGGTALCGGLEAGLEVARSKRQETNLVLVLSDGQANVGETDLEVIGQRAYDQRQDGITTSTLGVGSDYNEALMVELATQGGGRFYHVRDPQQIAAYMAGELGEISALAAQHASLHLTLPQDAGIQPFSSAYGVSSEATVTVGDIPIDTELEIVLRVLLPAQPAGARLPIKGTLTYCSPAGNELSAELNVVTLRYISEPSFEFRDGAVAPVVERVLGQMEARSVLGQARVAATKGAEAARGAAQASIDQVREYAALLGEDRAREAAADQQQVFYSMASAPSAAKASVHEAFRRQRSTKDFDT